MIESTMSASRHWDQEADVVVVGYGGAGAAVAITAHDEGSTVLILEKLPADTPTITRHTPNTRMSAGAWISATDETGAASHFEAMAKLAHETLDEERKEVIRVLAHNLNENEPWMRKLGMEWVDSGPLVELDYPELPGSEFLIVHHAKPSGAWRGGPAIFKKLTENVVQRGITVCWETPALKLIYEAGEVRGVLCVNAGKQISIKARKAVVLTCGGFEFNPWMKENYLRAGPVYFRGNRANTGDGITMALQVGAALWHMNCTSWRAVLKTEDLAFAFPQEPASDVIVDKRGSRFANEKYRGHAFGYDLIGFNSGTLKYPRIPCYWIFDNQRIKIGALAEIYAHCNPPGGVSGPDFYEWSKDNEAELDKGWILKANTLGELARIIANDPDNEGMMTSEVLEETVNKYNQYCRTGNDPEFGRPKDTLVPFSEAPFYAVKLWPGSTSTQGGPKRNTKCQVLRPDNSPIPRLYSAGELGSFWGMLTENGAGLGEAFVSGRIAGANSVLESRWG